MSDADLLFRALSDPTRRSLFENLCRTGTQTVGALTAFCEVSQPVVSRHLGVLKDAGLVDDRRQGRNTYYSARVEALAPLSGWAREMTAFWHSRFDKIEELLGRMDQ